MIAERLKAARLVAGLTQAELAHRIGITNVAVSKYERGLVVPDGERLVQLSEALGVSVAQLLRQQAELRVSTASFRWHPLQRRSRRVAEEVEAKVCEWLERYVALAFSAGVSPLLAITKADLAPDPAPDRLVPAYSAP